MDRRFRNVILRGVEVWRTSYTTAYPMLGATNAGHTISTLPVLVYGRVLRWLGTEDHEPDCSCPGCDPSQYEKNTSAVKAQRQRVKKLIPFLSKADATLLDKVPDTSDHYGIDPGLSDEDVVRYLNDLYDHPQPFTVKPEDLIQTLYQSSQKADPNEVIDQYLSAHQPPPGWIRGRS